jgi:predicted nucleotidyltransferase
MRLTLLQIELIRNTAQQLLGETVRVMLFGSRVRDDLKGGDVDLFVEANQAVCNPAVVSARLASRISRAMNGRHVDVVLKAPNLLHQPVHDIARQTGVLL